MKGFNFTADIRYAPYMFKIQFVNSVARNWLHTGLFLMQRDPQIEMGRGNAGKGGWRNGGDGE
jgi:hypothetical protein